MFKTVFSSGLRWLWLTGVVLILDRITKCYAQHYLSMYDMHPVFPGLNLSLSFNTGAAFSFLDSKGGWQLWFFGVIALIVSIAILIWLSRLSYRERGVSIALSLIVGGALGNLWDRISYGHVIDFIQLYVSHYYWPTFNVADSAICIGAVILFLSSFKSKAS